MSLYFSLKALSSAVGSSAVPAAFVEIVPLAAGPAFLTKSGITAHWSVQMICASDFAARRALATRATSSNETSV
jgi:hypothetical protein